MNLATKFHSILCTYANTLLCLDRTYTLFDLKSWNWNLLNLQGVASSCNRFCIDLMRSQNPILFQHKIQLEKKLWGLSPAARWNWKKLELDEGWNDSAKPITLRPTNFKATYFQSKIFCFLDWLVLPTSISFAD